MHSQARRTTVTLYSGLLFYIASLGLLCYAVAGFSTTLDYIHSIRRIVRGGGGNGYQVTPSYTEITNRVNEILAFLVLTMVAMAAWLATVIAFLIISSRATANLHKFRLAFTFEAVALCVFGIVAFSILGASTNRGLYDIEAAVIALWAASAAFAIATCVVIGLDIADGGKTDEVHQELKGAETPA